VGGRHSPQPTAGIFFEFLKSFMRSVRIKHVSIVLILIIFLGTIIVAAMMVYCNKPPITIPTGGTFFNVNEGESLSEIAHRLEREGLIRCAGFMIVLSKVMRTEGSFQAGPYKISPTSTTTDIHNMLVSGKRAREKITIPEGWTVKKIAKLIDSKGVADYEEFVRAAHSTELLKELKIPAESVEGYLFPDTYFFPEFYSPEVIIKTMVSNFYENLAQIVPDFETWNREELHNEIILASIVEREYRIEAEAPLIASVFKNRMKYNIGLESCATLEYIITEIEGKPHPKYLTLEDKSIDSPYNTYKWYGLPPGPISNPGRIALNATFHSADTNFYYFLLKDQNSGEHYFSKNLREHNEAKYIYLKGVAGQ
jgi:UPF0755 protein